ncbi:phytoene/squalene synthase family protein [Agromyces mangrovi Wang et al. 2018]|uniref:phytoene/squalene synthase family protein n=1 Tax=Agromyces mangrovi TaxID=1858653 RepID=UPI002573BF28|nr:squalene/phytoene synthase family protein [Agromyces mangrovi]BDZ66181.1 phytoene synthase [Agromyces mangrovi]
MSRDDSPGTSLDRYDETAEASASVVIGRYSTSFGAAARLLEPTCRRRIRVIYALVRIADEVVDGSAAEAGLSVDDQRAALDALEAETERAMRTGYSTNVVVHAFARTARATGIDASLTAPFFASMRRDLDPSPFTADEVVTYIYGSAEVVGLMCLRAFLADEGVDEERRARLEDGARHLGAAFQKVNFLRDLAVDWRDLGRNYFPGVDPEALTEAEKHAILDDIDADLTISGRSVAELPVRSRAAVAAAQELFARLASKLRATPADELLRARVRVPDAEKFAIAVRAAVTRGGSR